MIVTSEFHSVFHGVTDLAKFNYYIASCIFISCYSKGTGGKKNNISPSLMDWMTYISYIYHHADVQNWLLW